jgi:hypothetical protein
VQVNYDVYRYELERITGCCAANIAIECDIDEVAKQLTIRAIRQVATWKAQDELVVRTPADWWQHFKKRWYPEWVKARWPIVYDIQVYKALAYLPTLRVPRPEDKEPVFYGWSKV